MFEAAALPTELYYYNAMHCVVTGCDLNHKAQVGLCSEAHLPPFHSAILFDLHNHAHNHADTHLYRSVITFSLKMAASGFLMRCSILRVSEV